MTTPTDAGREKDVFISYARSDGKDFAAKLRDRLERENITCWQDAVGMEGGRDWWQQIQDAINGVEFLVLVMTPAAMSSANVRKEWRYARQQGVCVYPVIATDQFGALINDLPRWMRDSHFYNIGFDTDHFEAGMNWTKFLNDLQTRCDVPRVPFMPDDLGVYVPRTREYDALIDLLLDENRHEPKAITSALALKGAGGYSKTTLARAICHDERIQEAFDDGILWVTLGESATMDTVRTQLDGLITVLTGERSAAPTLEAAKTQFRELLADRDILLVIDDVWNADHARPFLQGGERVARLITTRDSETLPHDTQKVGVNAMTGGEAFDLLAYGLPADAIALQRAELTKLAAGLMEYPLPIKLANGILRDRVKKNQPLEKALAYVNDLLAEFGLALNNRQSVVEAALRASLDQLEASELESYRRLAIFPDDLDVPLNTLQVLWDARPAFTENLCERLEKLSLLLNFDPAAQTIRLHDVIRDFLLRQGGSLIPRHGMVGGFQAGIAISQVAIPEGMYLEMGGSVISWQQNFLGRYRQPGPNMMIHGGRKPVPAWADLPDGEPYLWNWLAYHLIEAARGEELVTTVLDLRYLAKKTILRGTAKVEADLEAAELYAEKNTHPRLEAIKHLTRNYRNMAHLLARCESVNDATVTLYTRLIHLESLKPSCDAVEPTLKRPYITNWHDLPDRPHPALIRTLAGHAGNVNSAGYSPDGRRIVSASQDKTLKVWDAETGTQILTLIGHSGEVTSASYRPDGKQIVSASSDGTLKIWDGANGSEKFTLRGHTGGVKSAAYSRDGMSIVSASSDGTLKTWDVETGNEKRTLQGMRGHRTGVKSAVFSPHARHILSAAPDGRIIIWNASTGDDNMTLRDYMASVSVKDAVYNHDGKQIASAMSDGTLRIWDPVMGVERLKLEGHSSEVDSVAYSQDGKRIVSASHDGTVKIWYGSPMQSHLTLSGHTGGVLDAAFSPDGRRIVSASDDGTLKIWDAEFREGDAQYIGYATGIMSVAYNPDGSQIVVATADGTLTVSDRVKGNIQLRLQGHPEGVNSVAYRPDGKQIVSASSDRTLKLWNAETGSEELTLSGHSGWVASAAYNPDGTNILSASYDGTVKVWDIKTATARLTLKGHTEMVTSAAYNPEGTKIVSTSYDGQFKVWDSVTGAEQLTLSGYTNVTLPAKYSPDGKSLISALRDNSITIWNSTTGLVQLTMIGHKDQIKSLTYNPTGTRVISAALDRTVRVWNTITGTCLAVFYAGVRVNCCAWSPDGQQIVAGGEGGHLYWLRWVE